MRMWRPARSTPAYGRQLLYCAVLLLSGCEPPGPDAPFASYAGRLGATLSIASPPVSTGRSLPPPLATELQLATATSSLDGVDFLSLSGCALQATLIKRNSSLGRHAKPSQRLLLALEYLRLAPPCITRLAGGNQAALADRLQAAWQLQREQLPTLVFNATLGGDEYRALWLSTPASGAFGRVSHRTAVAALGAINSQARRWLGGDYRADNREFEVRLSEVAGGDGGALLHALSRQHDWLAAADRVLAQHLARGTVCARAAGNAAPPVLPTGLLEHFELEIGTRAARTDRRYRQVLRPVAALEGQLRATLPPRYRDWMEERNRRGAQPSRTVGQHRAQLGRITLPCASG